MWGRRADVIAGADANKMAGLDPAISLRWARCVSGRGDHRRRLVTSIYRKL